MVIWITGLPGAGKTTIATCLLKELRKRDIQSILIDGDLIREVLSDFKYDKSSRQALAFLYARLAKMFSEQGCVAICATVSMFDIVRSWNRNNIVKYFEVYLQVTKDALHKRNQKGLYSFDSDKVNEGSAVDFSFFEEPKSPDLIIKNEIGVSSDFIIKQIIKKLRDDKLLTFN